MRTKAEINSSKWFGNLPEGWKMIPLPRLFSSSKGMTVTKADLIEAGSPIVNYAQIHSKANNKFGLSDELIKHVPQEMVPKGLLKSRKGSFIFACTSEDLAGCGACIYNDSDKAINPGGDTLLLTPKEGVENKYLAYLFSTDMWRWQIRRDLVDVKVFHVNQSNLRETYVVTPSPCVRKEIVSYLDKRCAAIDNDIAKRREVVEKLKEYKKSLIAHVVTKGRDPNAEMKDSGVEWIGNIPKEWNICKTKFLAKIIPGATPKSNVSSYWDGAIPFITPEDFSTEGHYVRSWNRTITKNGMDSCATTLLPKGALVVSSRAPIGLVSIVDVPVCTNQGCKGIVLRDNSLDSEYFYYTLSVAKGALNKLGNGTTYLELSTRSLSDFSVPVPSLSEQKSIVAFLDKQCIAIDEAIFRQEQLIEKLGEYRKAIIHHAVTGKIDCTEQ